MIVAFIPMLLIASAYYYMNKADPDCGTSFSWVTRAFGPHTGWITGWVIMAADAIVMANLAQVAGQYFFLLFGWQIGGRLHVRGHRRRRALHRADDVAHRRRHRDLGAHPVGAADRRADHPVRLLDHGAGEGLRLSTPPARCR